MLLKLVMLSFLSAFISSSPPNVSFAYASASYSFFLEIKLVNKPNTVEIGLYKNVNAIKLICIDNESAPIAFDNSSLKTNRDNKNNITRRLEDMNFIFSWQKTIFYERAQRVSKILFFATRK